MAQATQSLTKPSCADISTAPWRIEGWSMKAFAVFLSGIILFFLAAFGAEAAAPDAKRVALVIGNSKYINAVACPMPPTMPTSSHRRCTMPGSR
ncbi:MULTISPECIES: hypothetical protein [Mesorhizobium]|uniref:hypothetical protein n=1 Tax=Mesorhizobium australicum TaxID=536018 RepID=UPI003335F02F